MCLDNEADTYGYDCGEPPTVLGEVAVSLTNGMVRAHCVFTVDVCECFVCLCERNVTARRRVYACYM